MIDITDKKFKLPFFWTLVLMFLATSSSLILYSFGYTFSPERGVFVHAGSITVKSNPQDITVEMNGSNMSKKLNRLNNSFHIDGVRPGEYFIKISSPGFATWSKKISVHSGLSTEFWNVVLPKEVYEKNIHDSENVQDFFVSPGEKLIAYTKSLATGFSISILNIEENSSEEIFSSDKYSFTDDKEENIEWSPQSKNIILPLIKDSEKEYLSYNLEDRKTLSISELSQLNQISNVRWDSEDKDIIYFISQKKLYRMHLSEPQNKIVLAEDISSYDISGKHVYYFQLPSGIVYQIEAEGGSTPIQITTSAPEEMSDPSYKIIVYDQEKLVLRNGSGKLYIFNKGKNQEYFKKISDEARGTQFSNDGKKLLFWDNREIYVYFTTDWETQPYRKENDLMSITRYSQQLSSVQWSSDYEHVIFSVGEKVKLIELDNRDNKNTFDIITLSKEGFRVVNNFSDSKIYFIDKDANGGQKIHSIDFPEKTGVLGF